MRRHDFLFLATLTFVVLGSARFTHAQIDTSHTYCFGDSITDNTHLFLFYGTNRTLYGADPVEAMFQKASAETDTIHNYARVGSTSSLIVAQVNYYAQKRKAGKTAPATLISLQGGGNDVLFNVRQLAAETEESERIVRRIQHNLELCIKKLTEVDKAPIVLMTIPNLTVTPYLQSYKLTDNELAALKKNIQRLNEFILEYRQHPRMIVLEVDQVLEQVIDQSLTIAGTPLSAPPLTGASYSIFADRVHPTAAANALVANHLIKLINSKFQADIQYYGEKELAQLAGFPESLQTR
ncbi:MAG: hypothetical protein HUJ26_22030 [Planctomycetaceae bacterium]|nr:hypothetical protein [Planctomycetaceae bacterium]